MTYLNRVYSSLTCYISSRMGDDGGMDGPAATDRRMSRCCPFEHISHICKDPSIPFRHVNSDDIAQLDLWGTRTSSECDENEWNETACGRRRSQLTTAVHFLMIQVISCYLLVLHQFVIIIIYILRYNLHIYYYMIFTLLYGNKICCVVPTFCAM